MKLKIFHIIPNLGNGGAEHLLMNIVSKTSRSKFSHTIFVLRPSGGFAPIVRQNGGEVIELNLTGKRPWFAATRRIIPIISQRQPDLVLSYLYDASMVSSLVSFANRNIPLITTLHSPAYDSETIKAGDWSPRKVKILQKIDEFSAKLTKPNFVACSNYVAESYKNSLGIDSSKIRVIHNFVPSKFLNTESQKSQRLRKSIEIPKDGFVYLTVGRLDPPKGQIYLMKAFQEVLAEIPNAYLVIVGVGPSENDYKKAAEELKIDYHTRFLGSRNDVCELLEMADVFVFPTLFEGFGIALIEAMAKKLPCISTNLDVIREIVDDNISGILVESKSVSGLAENMIKLFKQPQLRKELGDKAFQKVQTCFSSDVIIPKWEELYLEISGKNQ
ncbi:MAG: glycosyltransferase family 4 protein [Parachlamydiaceae bacterium]|nr:glycosyltransferase family 4 protein [Parachlamydiaceae bacterium]